MNIASGTPGVTTMKRLLTYVTFAVTSLTLMAQGTVDDYKRAYKVRQEFNRSRVIGEVEGVRWMDNSTLVYHIRDAEGKMEEKAAVIDSNGKVLMVPPSSLPREDVDHRPARGDRQDERNNGHASMQANSTKTGPQKLKNHWMNVDEERVNRPLVSPDSSKLAYIRDYNLWVSDVNGSNAKQLSFDGTLSHYYSGYLRWSPDSRYIAINKIRPAEKRYVYYVESSPANQLQPILHQQEYAKPGDELLQKSPCVFEVSTGRSVLPDKTLYPNPYEIRGPEWNDDSQAVTFEYNERGHKVFRVLEMNVETGKMRTIVEEKSDKFVNYNRYYCHVLRDGKQMIWMSERDNWTHLYMVDIRPSKSGRSTSLRDNKSECPMRQITKGEWVVRKVLRIDEDKQEIFFTACGVNPAEDPYLIHYYKIGFDGNNMVCLTPENGNHTVQFNHDYTYLVDTYSRVDMAPVSVLRSVANPTEVTELGRADISRLEQVGFQMPEVFSACGRDGKTPMWGVIHRPSNFDPTRKYPIIEYIYAGPGDAYVPKSFQPYNWNFTSLAELGFIVVQVDGMGTSYRGKDFEEVCYKNLKDAGLPDHIAWIRAAAQKYPYMDADNVGIYGCSAGGQESTTAVLLHGDFYKCAYSACGCHDNRMDKIWWNEQWMGWPVDSAYIECSNVTHAHKLERPLMLVVGELDDNVDPASTMQVADALIKAGKDFELVVIPGAHHTMGEDFGERKRHDFFVKNLLHVNPPKWSEIK